MSNAETNSPPVRRMSDVGPSTTDTDSDGIMWRDGPTAAEEPRPSAQSDDAAADIRVGRRDAAVIYVRVNSAMSAMGYSPKEQMEALRRLAGAAFIPVPEE